MRKEHLTSFDLAALASEFQELVGSFIDKIYELSGHVLLLKLNAKTGKNNLVVDVINGWVFNAAQQDELKTPTKPTDFAFALRKYLTGGVITSVRQQEFDRIVEFEIQHKDKNYRLIIAIQLTAKKFMRCPQKMGKKKISLIFPRPMNCGTRLIQVKMNGKKNLLQFP